MEPTMEQLTAEAVEGYEQYIADPKRMIVAIDRHDPKN